MAPPAGQGERPRRRVWPALVAVLLLGLAGAGSWTAGLFDGLVEPELPLATPYRLTADFGPSGATLSGNAPDVAAAEALRQAFATATGTTPPETALTLAQGVPGDRWAASLATVFPALGGLEEWSLSVSDAAVTVTGIAPNRDLAADRRKALSDWSASTGLKTSSSISVGPRALAVAQVNDILAPFAQCGPLTQARAEGESYALGETVVIDGAVIDTASRDMLQQALEDTVGDRKVRVDATVLNADLCAVRKVLPPLESEDLTIWLGDGASGQVNLSGIYRPGENPVVEVLAPADLAGLSLWVVVVDNTGKVFNLLPNINQGEHDLAEVGTIVDGLRRVRVLHSIEDLKTDKTRLAMLVNEDNFGKSEVIAILSRTSLFGIRRPKDESISSFAEALAAITTEEPGNIVSIATRVIDARP